jgi:hypothetical protein
VFFFINKKTDKHKQFDLEDTKRSILLMLEGIGLGLWKPKENRKIE